MIEPIGNVGNFLRVFNNFSSGINYRFYLNFYFVFVLKIIFISVLVKRKLIIFVSVSTSVHENIADPIFLCPYPFLKLVSFLGANRTINASVGPQLLKGAI